MKVFVRKSLFNVSVRAKKNYNDKVDDIIRKAHDDDIDM